MYVQYVCVTGASCIHSSIVKFHQQHTCDYIIHLRWCSLSSMITNKAEHWGQNPPLQSTWIKGRSGRVEGGVGEEGVYGVPDCLKQGALYNDWLFTWWLIVLHRPVCGLRRPALMFAEWHTVLSECQDVMSGCLECPHTCLLLLYAVSLCYAEIYSETCFTGMTLMI